MRDEQVKQKIEEIKVLLKQHGFIKENECSIGLDRDTNCDIFMSKTVKYSIHDDPAVNAWVDKHLGDTIMSPKLIPLDKVDKWRIDDETGNIIHDSGRFFVITGLKVRHRWRFQEIEWDQPIIDQPEIGILGLLARRINGVLHFCMQAKEEPGNVNLMQLAPTVQATYSNYTAAHGGRPPHFISLFIDPPREKVLFSRLQTEDGGRFLFKSNRNMVVMLEEDETSELPEGFIWLTLRQISNLMKRDNLINRSARSVLACLM